MSMSGSICSGELAAASRRAVSMLTWHLHRYPEALTPVTHAISGRTGRELLYRITATGEGEMADKALPWRRILLTAWTWPPVLTISADTRTVRCDLNVRSPCLLAILFLAIHSFLPETLKKSQSIHKKVFSSPRVFSPTPSVPAHKVRCQGARRRSLGLTGASDGEFEGKAAEGKGRC